MKRVLRVGLGLGLVVALGACSRGGAPNAA